MIIDRINDKDLQMFHQYFETFAVRLKSNDQQIDEINQRLTNIRQQLIQRYRIRNNFYRRKFPQIVNKSKTNKLDIHLLKLKSKRCQQSIDLFKQLIYLQVFNEQFYYEKEFEQSTTTLENLKEQIDFHQNELERSQKELNEQLNQIHLYSDELIQIQLERQTTQSHIQQMKENIRIELQIFNAIKEHDDVSMPIVFEKEQIISFDRHDCLKKFFDKRSKIFVDQPKISPLKIIFDRHSIEHDQQRNDLRQLIDEKKKLIVEENHLHHQLEQMKTNKENQLIDYQNEYVELTEKIDRLQIGIEENFVDLLPLQFEIHLYQTLLDRHDISSNQPVSKRCKEVKGSLIVALVNQCQSFSSTQSSIEPEQIKEKGK